MAITLMQICNAIDDFVAAATGMSTSQSQARGELSEDIGALADKPLIQTYFVSLVTSQDRTTDRVTFGGGTGALIRQTALVFHVDMYVRQRSWLGEDLKACLVAADALQTQLETIKKKPYFNLTGIQAVSWTAEFVTFRYGAPEIAYVGNRFIITVVVF